MVDEVTRRKKKTIISEISLQEIKQINEYAIANELSVEETALIFIGEKPTIGNRSPHTYSNEYYKFVISVENSPSSDFKKMYKIQRLSALLKIPGKYPSVELLKFISEQLKFPGFEKCRICKNDNDPKPHIEISHVISERILTEESDKLKQCSPA